MTALPTRAAWRHLGLRTGFEVVRIETLPGRAGGHRFTGTTTAVQDGAPWAVTYVVETDAAWRTRSARVRLEDRSVRLTSDGAGRWEVDGHHDPALDGCLDVDLESSALTNAFPMRRLDLDFGEATPAPAAYVGVDLAVTVLQQDYRRLPDGLDGRAFDYTADAFGFRAVLEYDAAGLVQDYPGLAVRVL